MRLLASFALAVVSAQAADTLVIGAAEFFDTIPAGDIIGEARAANADWVYNNNVLCLKSKGEPIAKVQIPQRGEYRLFVRSQGADRSSFRVAVNGRRAEGGFGRSPIGWQPGGSFALNQGSSEIRLTEVSPGSCVDVLVLTTDASFDPAHLPRTQLPSDVAVLKEYKIPMAGTVKFGDVTGDGKTDFMVLTRAYSAHVFDHDGKELWKYEAPEEGTRQRGEFEPPGSVWDLDRDGAAEVIHYRIMDGKEWLVVADGKTGAIRHKVEWPTTPMPHVYNNFRIAIGRLTRGYPANIIVLTDSGGTISITAYAPDLKQLWQHTEKRLKDHLGHYVYPVDLTGDGIDEIVVSPLVLNASGKLLWSRFDLFSDNHDHSDSFKFADLNGDGKPEILASVSDVGVVVFQAMTGEVLWKQPANHSQQLQVGQFLDNQPGPHVAVTARTYGRPGEPGLSGQIYWFGPKGALIAKWPPNPLNGNPDFVKGDWTGAGKEELFWYKFKLTRDGRGTLYFENPVYHMLDFMGFGREEVVAIGGGMLRVYGYSQTTGRKPVKRDSEYLRNVANHTHY